jgi:hypothetical protein
MLNYKRAKNECHYSYPATHGVDSVIVIKKPSLAYPQPRMSGVQSPCTTYGHSSRSTERRVPGTFTEAPSGTNPYINIRYLSFNVRNSGSRTMVGQHPFLSGRLCVTFTVHDNKPLIKTSVIQAICKFEKYVEILQWLPVPASANKIHRSVQQTSSNVRLILYRNRNSGYQYIKPVSNIGRFGRLPGPRTSRSRNM